MPGSFPARMSRRTGIDASGKGWCRASNFWMFWQVNRRAQGGILMAIGMKCAPESVQICWGFLSGQKKCVQNLYEPSDPFSMGFVSSLEWLWGFWGCFLGVWGCVCVCWYFFFLLHRSLRIICKTWLRAFLKIIVLKHKRSTENIRLVTRWKRGW